MKLRQGDVIKTNFTPQAGHEQAGFRPAVILSNESFNEHSNLTIVCPVTHTDRKNPFHLVLNNYDFIDGYAMCDNIRSVDLRSRGMKYIGHLDENDINEINDILNMFFETETEENSTDVPLVNVDQELMDIIAGYMNDEIRETLHSQMAPCEPLDFLKAYITKDEDFLKLLESEFYDVYLLVKERK